MKQELLNRSQNVINSPNFVLSKYCQVLAAFTLVSGIDGITLVIDKITKLQQEYLDKVSVSQWILLEFFSSLTEQIQSIDLTKQQRYRVFEITKTPKHLIGSNQKVF